MKVINNIMTNALTHNPSLPGLREMAVVFITVLLLITGWQFIKEVVAIACLKWYEILIQQNPVKI